MRRRLALLCLFAFGCPPTVDQSVQFCVDQTRAHGAFLERCGAFASAEAFSLHAVPCTPSPHLRFDASRAAKCLQSLATVSCSTSGFDCDGVFEGVRSEGESCFEGECLPGLVCDFAATCPGQCVRPGGVGTPSTNGCESGAADHEGLCVPTVAEGGSCFTPDASVSSLPCERGALCTVNGTCALLVRADAGAYCQPDLGLSCGEGTECIGDGCAPLPRPGETCAGFRQCQADLSCVGNVCVGAATSGALCEADRECRASLFCGFDEGATVGNCMPRIEEGNACFVGAEQCEVTLTCDLEGTEADRRGRCQLRHPRGASCRRVADPNVCAHGLFCNATALEPEGTCVDLKTRGRCETSVQCQSGWCQEDGGCLPSCLRPVP
ncbi:MAG: hypothetical protein JNM17_39045 [Archangium sp.]|nr:hypothetical protein [Archangium sp.]